MKIKVIINGYLEENCYIISKNNKALIVDPGNDYEKIKKYIKEEELEIIGILITHYHFDHILILKEVLKNYKVEIYDYKNINQNIKINEFKFLVIDTKGHSDDSVSFYFETENLMFTGDFLFKETIGNYDLENEKYMINSLKKIKTFDKNTRILPGHGEGSTIGYELLNNPFLKE